MLMIYRAWRPRLRTTNEGGCGLWRQYTGIEISKTKMRTFGTHWGVYKEKNPPLLIHWEKWEKTEVPMKMDGTMKS